MPDPKYSFEEHDDDIYVSYTAPCGDAWKDVAVIREFESKNPVLQLRDGRDDEFVGNMGISGLIEIIAFLQKRRGADALIDHTKKHGGN